MSEQTTGRLAALRDVLRDLYERPSERGVRFRYALLAFDLVAIVYVVATSFAPRTVVGQWIDVAFGVLLLADFAARQLIVRSRTRELLNPATWADVVAIGSFLTPMLIDGAGFLRIVRTLRLLHAYQLVVRLRGDSPFFRRHEDAIFAVAHLVVFIFVMTGVVHQTQHATNPQISNYADALYFTVTALTTTGFGDITLPGTGGRLITVVIMILGVTLFFNLARTLLQPSKVRFPCPTCALQRHDRDAVHCKACGTPLNIPDDGYD